MIVTYIKWITGYIDKISLYASLFSGSLEHDLNCTLSHRKLVISEQHCWFLPQDVQIILPLK